jgi:protein transport protein SEC61 subunit gamma-like protein
MASSKNSSFVKTNPKSTNPKSKSLNPNFNLVSKIKEEGSLIVKFWKKLIQPTRDQYCGSLKLHAIGIGLVGLVGYVIKLIHVPINNILVNN